MTRFGFINRWQRPCAIVVLAVTAQPGGGPEGVVAGRRQPPGVNPR